MLRAGAQRGMVSGARQVVAIGEGRSREAPTMQEVARLEDARAKRNAIERELNDFMTTRR